MSLNTTSTNLSQPQGGGEGSGFLQRDGQDSDLHIGDSQQAPVYHELLATPRDAVTQQKNSQAVLEALEAANLFIVPLDNERRWYRYLHLFADLLRQRLHQSTASSTWLDEVLGIDVAGRGNLPYIMIRQAWRSRYNICRRDSLRSVWKRAAFPASLFAYGKSTLYLVTAEASSGILGSKNISDKTLESDYLVLVKK